MRCTQGLAEKRSGIFSEGQGLAAPSGRLLCLFGLQGGLFTPDEVAEFEMNPFWRDDLRLRRWDDTGKVDGLETRLVADFADVLDACVLEDAE